MSSPSSAAGLIRVRARPRVRSLAWLLLALLLAQLGAQWCAAQCGISAFAGAGPAVAISAVPADAAAPPGRIAATADSTDPAVDPLAVAGDAPCLLLAWCELGQASLLPAVHAASVQARASVLIPSENSRPALFLIMPGDRPPTA